MRIALLLLFAIAIGIASFINIDRAEGPSILRSAWQQSVSPGMLSRSHGSMSNNCAACHAPVKGIEPTRCIACHANDTSLLQRQPTAFHASIQTCGGCHVEHRGGDRMPTRMDHALLAKAGHEALNSVPRSEEALGGPMRAQDIDALAAILDKPASAHASMPEKTTPAPDMRECAGATDCAPPLVVTVPAASNNLPAHPGVSVNESMLNCAACHQTKDRHQGTFGTDCVQCHATTSWKIAEFRHPSTRSTECSQCHKAPPSHNMMHFSMVSARVAGQQGAKVNQCFLCHQTTSWNDIRGKGWYKHH